MKGGEFMKGKQLVMINGIVGLAGGILLLIAPIFLLGTAANDLGNIALGSSSNSTGMLSALILVLKVALLVLGIMGAVQFKESTKVTSAPNVLLIVAGALSFIPFLGWVGGIIAIVGGSLYLGKLKNFKVE